MSTVTMTARQAAAWPEAVKRARKHAAYSHIPEDVRSWSCDWADETRPGRGHHLNATYLDGDVFVQVLMDVYGYPTVSVAALDWIHADSDEECACDPCIEERATEGADDDA